MSHTLLTVDYRANYGDPLKPQLGAAETAAAD